MQTREFGHLRPVPQSACAPARRQLLPSNTLFFFSFCEEDYVVTIFIAEFINSLTNLVYGTPEDDITLLFQSCFKVLG